MGEKPGMYLKDKVFICTKLMFCVFVKSECLLVCV